MPILIKHQVQLHAVISIQKKTSDFEFCVIFDFIQQPSDATAYARLQVR